jgi:hypothetical protein
MRQAVDNRDRLEVFITLYGDLLGDSHLRVSQRSNSVLGSGFRSNLSRFADSSGQHPNCTAGEATR